MPNPQFPDLGYLLSKSYEGTNRQDFAELSAGYMRRVREELQNYKPQFSDSVAKTSYDAILQSVMQQLDELEKYYDNFHHNRRPRILQSAAQETLASMRKQIDVLEKLSKK